jgi:adenylate cyclase
MAQIFISYARSDEAVARRVADGLRKKGFDVWWDADLPAHRTYSEVIEKHLQDAKAVVVLWSQAAAQSQWVRAEADFARNQAKLVQAQVDGSLPPMPFNQIQCADLKGWRGNARHMGWSKLVASVGALISGEEPAPLPASPATVRWWNLPQARWMAAAAVLLILAAAFLVPRYLGDDGTGRPVVAVLPFDSLDKRDESLVAGIWEDTRQAISRNPQLLVLGPNTSEQLAEQGEGAVRKAADYLVQASVRSVGDRIRVNTNLVRTEDGAQLWSENFDRRLDDVFALQSEIAREIEGRIRGRLAEGGGVQPQHIATTGEVYALYSDARTKIRRRQMGRYEEAADQLRQVVRMDPNFAPGWATLAVIKKFETAREQESSAESDARRAIALAPNLAAGHAALGFALGQGPAAQASLRRALKLDPNDIEALNWLANSLDPATQVRERLALYSRIVEIEPLWWPAVMNKLSILHEQGNTAAVEKELARVEQLGSLNLAAAIKMDLLSKSGDLSGLVSLGLSRWKRATGPDRDMIGMFLLPALLQLGYVDMADKVFPPPNDYIPYIRANDRRALDMMEEQHGERGFWTYGYLNMVGARVYLLNGEGPRLARLYRAVAASPEQFEGVVGKFDYPDIAPGVALALRSAGDEPGAQALLQLAETRAAELRAAPLEKQIRLARIHAVQGRTDQAIGELSSAIRGGWLPPYLPIHTDIALDPPLAELKKDPRFEPLRRQILGHLAKERAELGPISLD